jgi:uncharacterized protein YkwD
MREPDRFPAGRIGAAIVAVCFALIALSRPAAAEDPRLAALRNLALQMVNASRAENKLPPLTLEDKLTAAAQSHAGDMLKRSYFAHESPEGKNVGDRFQAAGGSEWVLTAENIGKCAKCAPPLNEADLHLLHDGWMKSPGHRANILRKGLTKFGFGMASNEQGGLYAVQTFSGPGVQKAAENGAGAKPVSAAALAKAALAELNERRKQAGFPPLELSQSLADAASETASKISESSASVDVGSLGAMLPLGEQASWRSIQAFSSQCGGCGREIVTADIAYFIEEWMADQTYAKMLLGTEFTHLGFSVRANGEGLKAAVGLLGRQ